MKKLSKYKIVSIILTIAVCLSLVPLSVFAVNPQATLPETPEISAELLASLPETLDADAIAGKGHISRLYAEETDLNSVVFDNGNGAQSVYIFGEDIKYIDKDGKTRDKSNKLQSVIGGYTNPYNDIQVFYPTEISSGITVNYKDYTVNMVPMPDISSNEMSTTSFATLVTEDKRTTPDAVKYNNVFGANTAVEYIQQFTGFKEIITVEEYTGQTEFAFMITTNGLTLALNEGTAELTDPATKTVVGKLGDLVMWDSINTYYTGEYTIEEIKPNDIYVVVIDATEILTNPDTVYPVYVDPAMSVDPGSNTATQDVTIYTEDTSTHAIEPFLVIGDSTAADSTLSRGVGRTFARFKTLFTNTNINSYYTNKTITGVYYSAKVATPLNDEAEPLTIEARFSNSNWPETLRYNNSSWNYGADLISRTVYNNTSWLNIDLTYAYLEWKSSNPRYASNFGFVLKLADESKGIAIYSSENTNTSLIPCAVVETMHFYSNVPMIYKIRNIAESDYYISVKNGLDYKGTDIYAEPLQVSGNDVDVWKSNYSKQFILDYTSETNEYVMKALCSQNGLHREVSIDTTKQDKIILDHKDDESDNVFMITQVTTGQYKISRKSTMGTGAEKVLTAGTITNNEAPDNISVTLETYTSDNHQKWVIEPDYNAYVEREYYRMMTGQCYPLKTSSSATNAQNNSINDITSGYGFRNAGVHYGLDIEVIYFADVYSIWDGTVVYVDESMSNSRGKNVVVRADDYYAYGLSGQSDPLYVVYMHMSDVVVSVNDPVIAGETILGKSGNTGENTFIDTHLHISIITDTNSISSITTLSNTVDPFIMFDELDMEYDFGVDNDNDGIS
ncbi:MAG: M23 family metallopeptidase [Clostridia bacterium]|nr:M23 family metallopeptidase [Clostridia bacterium]